MKKDYMYAVDRSDEYLAHYGIKGMKWGVRKAIESGNARKLDRAYRKASRKLARLEKQANSGKKYARRAAVLGAGAAAAGGLAAAGTQGVARAVNTIGSKGGSAMRRLGTSIGAATPGASAALSRMGFKKTAAAVNAVGSKAGAGLRKAGTAMGAGAPGAGQAISQWGRGTAMTMGNATSRKLENVASAMDKLAASKKIKPGAIAPSVAAQQKAVQNAAKWHQNAANARTAVSNNTLARIGAGVAAAGLAGAAGYNAYRAATTKRAAQKAQQFRSEMNKAFAGTKYAKGGGSSSSSSGNSGNSGSKKRRRR